MSEATAESTSGWPAHLHPGALRWARTSSHYDATIRFYRDVVGLPVVDCFIDSFGEEGTIFGLPDTAIQLEIVRARAPGDQTSADRPIDQLALYLDTTEKVVAATAPLRAAGFRPDPTPHPYWAANGAVIFHDPDGRQVVFAPWVYGRDPEPSDADPHEQAPGGPDAGIVIADFEGPRASLRSLFELAEDSREQVDRYIDEGTVLVARRRADVVGHLQVVATKTDTVMELKNMAVVPELRGTGVGRALIAAALARCRSLRAARLLVAAAAADVGKLRFYQRCGFRFIAVEPDAFTPSSGYPDPILIDGIPLLDRVWLAQDL
jgi:GNAT superfamily N-acetyltransferase